MSDSAERPVAVVTGATGGIGGSIAQNLSRTHDLWLVGRNVAALQSSADQLPRARSWALDLGAERPRIDLPDDLDRLDVLVLAAGTWSGGRIESTPGEVWRGMFTTNLFGHIELTRMLLPCLRTAAGRVVIISSTAVTGSPATRAPYAASKLALGAFGQALHEEERDNGVQVSTVVLGRVATRMQESVCAAEGQEYKPENYVKPSIVADAVRWIVDAAPEAHVSSLVLQPPYRPGVYRSPTST